MRGVVHGRVSECANSETFNGCAPLQSSAAEDGVFGISLPFVPSQRVNFQNCAFEHPLEKRIKGKIQGQSVQTEVGDTKFGVLHNIGCSKTNRSLYFCYLSEVKTVFNFFKCSADP